MSETTEKKTSGALDVRNIIGALLTVYGVILLLMGIFAGSEPASPDAPPGGGDVNANLWAGLALLVVGLGFIAWWRLRPIVVPDEPQDSGKQDVQRPEPS